MKQTVTKIEIYRYLDANEADRDENCETDQAAHDSGS